MSTLSRLQRFIHRHGLLPDGARIVVGVSGGPDSLALLHALGRLAPDHGWWLHVAHLHHGLRPEADEEAWFVAEVAAAWDLGCTIERADVEAIAAQPGVSLEEAARQARYAFLGAVARRLNAGYVAVGHNADDQLETVLMHFLRGSGLAGLRGMLPSTPLAGLRLTALPPDLRPDVGEVRLVRPWLETPRAEILAYCREHELTPRYDMSNIDQTFFRNRLRHRVIPLLREINPRLTQVVGRTAAVLQGEHEVLEAHRRALWQEVARVEPERVRLELATFRALARADQRALLRMAMSHLRPEHRNLAWEHGERLLDLLADRPEQASGGPYPLVAGLVATLSYRWLEVGEAEAVPAACPQIHEPRTLSLPGEVALE
ncbi:MAG: tRNA lysidine(34) synthetase TilS, partial [Caldilineae bacterium]